MTDRANEPATDRCAVCGALIEACPYGGDCGEMQTIYHEQQREKMADLDPEFCEEYARKHGYGDYE